MGVRSCLRSVYQGWFVLGDERLVSVWCLVSGGCGLVGAIVGMRFLLDDGGGIFRLRNVKISWI